MIHRHLVFKGWVYLTVGCTCQFKQRKILPNDKTFQIQHIIINTKWKYLQ